MDTSTFFIPLPAGTMKVLFLFIAGLGAARLFLQRRFSKELLFSLLLAVVYILVYLSDRYPFLLFLGALTVGCFLLNSEKLLKMYCVVTLGFLLITFLSAAAGGIENYIYLKDGFIRSSLGMVYPTDVASALFFLLCASWVGWKKMPDGAALTLGIFSAWFSNYVTRSITGTICSILFVVIVSLHIIHKNTVFRNKLPKLLKKGVSCGMILAFPACTVITFALIYAYARNMEFAVKLNNIITNRLGYALDAFRSHGVSAFGKPFDMQGNGGTTFAVLEYTFVDISYALILLRYGFVLLICLSFFWPRLTWKAIKDNNWRLADVLFLITVHSLSEHHFIEMNYNVFLILFFADFTKQRVSVDEKNAEIDTKEEDSIGKRLPGAALIIMLLAVFLKAFPALLSRLRTVYQILGWKPGSYNGLQVFLTGTAIVVCIVCFIAALVMTVLQLKKERKRALLWCGLAGVCIACVIGGHIKSEQIISYGEKKYASLLTADQSAVKIIQESGSGKLYAEPFPELYGRKYGGFSNSFFTGEDLARLYDTTVITDLDKDAYCMLNSGFLFTPISEKHAVYTNDLSVIEGLKTAGYHLTGYYSADKSVNLRALARMNGLREANGELFLYGEDESIYYGPYADLHAGNYTVDYEFRLAGSDSGKSIGNTLLGTAYITAYCGEKKVKEARIVGSRFDENGRYCLSIPFYSESYKDMEFTVVMEEDQELVLEAIHYRQTPKYDVHSLYNRQRKNYRDEYYDLDGNPVTRDEGFAACEFERNADGVVTEIRYYDEKNDPVMITLGYARLVRKLNSRNQIIREEYYDVNDERVLLEKGYWAEEREYDKEKNIILRRYLDTENRPVITLYNYAEIHRVFDGENHVTRESYFGVDGKPLALPQGYAAVEREYDSAGNITLIRYFGVDGKPVITTAEYSEVHRKYDNRKQIIEESYFDENGEPLMLPAGYAMQQREYDGAGNVIINRYYDTNHQKVMTASHYAELHRTYNSDRRAIREEYFDTEGKRTPVPHGYCIYERDYDAAGNPIIQRYYDEEEKPVMTDWGCAEIHREYNDRKQFIRESYFDTQGNPIALPQGYYSRELAYDEAGNTSVQKYFDLEGNLMTTAWGYAEIHRDFNEKKQIIRETYYDTEGRITVRKEGYAIREFEYDADGKVKAERHFDVDRKLITDNK